MKKSIAMAQRSQVGTECNTGKDLTIALVNQTMENFRFSINKLSQLIITYLAVQGFSFGVFARGELELNEIQLAATVNILVSIGSIVFIGVAYKNILVSVSAMHELIGHELAEKVMIGSQLILATYVMLNVFVVVAIGIWVSKIVG